ncbi:MAG TPA: cyclic lactone autoinducer peptide [Clostridiales bacterium]|nr:cyclic lactone autoinducer peptide [Clostridiales bacterium]
MKLCLGMGSLAFTITSINVNTTCMFFMHQPKLPKGAEKLKKI